MPPMPTVWWFRPDSIAARVGEHNAVVWKRVNFSPSAASRSNVGVSMGPPKALLAPKPTSSIRITRTLGAPSGGRSRRMGGNLVSGDVASYVTVPVYARSGIGSELRCTSSVPFDILLLLLAPPVVEWKV